MDVGDWLLLFLHHLFLSLLAVGGTFTTAPEMHRFMVVEKGWLTDPQFSSSIAIAQAAPGPNVLFIALVGWNIGLNSGGIGAGLLGMALTMTGILLPSSTLAYLTARWSHENRKRRPVRAFKQGMAPAVVALLVATGWILATGRGYAWDNWPIWTLALVSTLLVWRSRIHLLILLGAGGVIGWFGWV